MADEAYLAVGEALKGIYPVLDDAALETLHAYHSGASSTRAATTLTTQYDRYMDAGSGEALSNTTTAFFIRYADDLIYCGVALILAALALLFSRTLVVKLGIPRIIISLFFILLCLLALLYDLSLSTLLSNSVVRMGMNAMHGAGHGAGHPVRHQPEPGSAASALVGGPDRRPDVPSSLASPAGAASCLPLPSALLIAAVAGMAVWPAAQPPQGRARCR